MTAGLILGLAMASLLWLPAAAHPQGAASAAGNRLPPAPRGDPRNPGGLPEAAHLDRLAAQQREHREGHRHGQWLMRILPARLKPSELPQAQSVGARTTARYCTQCHELPDPAMHGAARWEGVVQRMLPRMRGEGNQGRLMRDMMQGLAAPDAEQARIIIDYLALHAGLPLAFAERDAWQRDRRAAPTVPQRPGLTQALATEDGRMFQGACSQCHELPDPAGHRAAEWPAVVERMQANMQWMNRVVGSGGNPREPRLDPVRITGFLQAFSSDAPTRSHPR